MLNSEHHKMKTFACTSCDKVLASSQSLWNHRQRCKMHYCERCNIKFTRKASLLRHINEGRCKGVKTKPVYTCKRMQHASCTKLKKVIRLTFKWDGDSWRSSDNLPNELYKVQLGRDLDNLIKKGAIKEDVLTCRQIENVNLYRKLFQ